MCVFYQQRSGQGRSQHIEARKREKRDEMGHAKIEGNRRQEREKVKLTYSPDSQRADENVKHHKMTKGDPIACLETQDSINLEFLDIGSDGNEEQCHNCGLGGNLTCCSGCPIAMHIKCVKLLGLKVPRREDNWFCPVCSLHKATREAAEAEKVCFFSLPFNGFVLHVCLLISIERSWDLRKSVVWLNLHSKVFVAILFLVNGALSICQTCVLFFVRMKQSHCHQSYKITHLYL